MLLQRAGVASTVIPLAIGAIEGAVTMDDEVADPDEGIRVDMASAAINATLALLINFSMALSR